MSVLFESSEINGMQLRNRFVRSATWEGLAADDGAPTERLTGLLAELSRGGVGLIIAGHAFVREEGRAGRRQLGMHTDRHLPGLRRMTGTVREHGARLVAQLAHSGAMANPKLTGRERFEPSRVSADQIHELADGFAGSAARAKQAGFDGVQIHAAHGYLLSQFLSPYFNKRTDQYGGPIENRARAAVEVVARVRAAVGSGYPLLVKLNCEDFLPGGLTLEDSRAAARMLSDAGVDAVEVSGGTVLSKDLSPSRMRIHTEERQAYFRDQSRILMQDATVILVGGIRSLEVAGKMLAGGNADYISLSRPLIREPDLINRWASGDNAPARCISDNQCFLPAMQGEGIYCVVDRNATGPAPGNPKSGPVPIGEE